ncbi:2-hydroxyacid dehydrogenase [Rhizobium sp. YIM 134829]|uniref:2-hydroxyacid dehydrogenase n=1 Tax=Rhizobium sp. YIM 134829 TaxID=3390453 RepID=UPI00397DBF82
MSDPRPAILIPGKMNQRVLDRLGDRFEILRLDGADPALVTPEIATRTRAIATFNKVSSGLMDAVDHLEIVANFGVGYDGVDAAHAATKGIVVTNTPNVLDDEVADTTIGLLLNTLRRFPAAEAYLRAGKWASDGPFPLSPLTLRGRTVGLYGLGRIGLAIARRLEAFGVTLAYYTRNPRPDVPYRHYPTLKGLAEAVDTLIVIVPGTDSTRHTVNAEIFSALGEKGVVISIGRGITVDERALIEALQAGTIAAAGLDVFENEPHVPQALIDLPTVALLPHVGSASVATRDAMSDLVADNLIAWFEKGEAVTPVSETPFTRRGR